MLLLLAAAETSFITGLVVPAGVATAFGAFLASEGYLSLAVVVGFAGTGALVGDSVGFWLGRRYGVGLLRGGGRLRRLARRHEPRATALFQGHPIYAVTFARLVSFVRTLMPLAAGMSRVGYARFLAYDLLGVGGWVVAYVAAGYLAGRSWRWVAGALGTGWAVAFAAVGLGWWLAVRYRKLREADGAPPGGRTLADAGPRPAAGGRPAPEAAGGRGPEPGARHVPGAGADEAEPPC